MLHVTLDLRLFHTAVARTLDSLENGIERAVAEAARDGAEEARRVGRFQDRTGQLRRNITAFRVTSSFRSVTWNVLSPMPYSMFVEKGTRPHPIYARNAPFLVFFWPKVGRVVRFKKVNHPGGRPYPYMGPGYLKAERALFRNLSVLTRDIGRHWSGGVR